MGPRGPQFTQTRVRLDPGTPDDMNRQLRDLLQRQEGRFKKLDLPGSNVSPSDQQSASQPQLIQQRIWPPQQQPQGPGPAQSGPPGPDDPQGPTFRQPLPPSQVRTQGPLPLMQQQSGPQPRLHQSGVVVPPQQQQQSIIIRQQRMLDPRLVQSMDPRTRLILQQHQQNQAQRLAFVQQQQMLRQQQQQQAQQQQQGQRNNLDPYDHLVQQTQQQQQRTSQSQQAGFSPGAEQGPEQQQQQRMSLSEDTTPDSVNAELDKMDPDGRHVASGGEGREGGGRGGEDGALRIPLFNAVAPPAPPVPPEHIASDQDRLTQLNYETWLNTYNNFVTQQLKYYEAEMTKVRKSRKEQPLLLEELLEQEKREQEKQAQGAPGGSGSPSVLLSDADFERLRADVLDHVASPPVPGPGRLQTPQPPAQVQHRIVTASENDKKYGRAARSIVVKLKP
ncbi:adenylate cyclase, terminal-differentiation specific-like [Diaphorina citri]|uniref:Adenylate cyclase, terminal-differentiation specific-like n=1 Tax=Diaphorina citri TaxID=121845 RepID=A0A3Q0JBJ5_DIACI|nr:adenylate cyclase, terminal-differentiation specific-like [Diaphorina citri]